jgi:hypothetical protein
MEYVLLKVLQKGAMVMNKISLSQLAQSILLLFCLVGQASAQAATGTIRGTVSDPSGALVPQAAVTLSNATGLSREIKSSGAGTFEMTRVVPGRYSLSINAKGFAPVFMNDVAVFGDKVTSRSVKLQISV